MSDLLAMRPQLVNASVWKTFVDSAPEIWGALSLRERELLARMAQHPGPETIAELRFEQLYATRRCDLVLAMIYVQQIGARMLTPLLAAQGMHFRMPDELVKASP